MSAIATNAAGSGGAAPGGTAPLAVLAFRQPELLTRLGEAEWNLLLRQCAAANLQPRLYYVLQERGELDAIPARARRHLEWSRTVAERHSQAVRWEVELIRQALAGLDTPLILLKGAAYALAGLPPARGRLFSDIDILVPKEKLDDAESALMLHGWASTHLDAYDQRYYRRWMHELPPMEHVKRRTAIDVHHAILPTTAPVHPDPVQLRAAAQAVPGQPGLQVLAPPDLVLHSATHLFFDGELEHGLRDLVDLDGLLRHFGGAPGFWPALAARAAQLQLQRPLFYALRYTALLLHTPLPPEADAARQAGRPGALLLRLMDSLYLRALLPAHASCGDALTPSARFLLYIRANWLRMPPLLLARHLLHKALFPPKESAEAEEKTP
ncbi:nucleotidyltransferase family protein [Pseudoduganella sp. LjRoot289]|uniref:nucleotidyltransferase domain-containing protein n=1 Tax=Pseudoduganella sp. LjRoot289 TaxID=3342314 RepID=UPI003ECED9F8